MYLKGIGMHGFKSFADKIDLEFGQGITAIVGPNGSGKSNISDAIRWVMGEQSAKSLRGGKMEDVIFAGTQKRSPLGFAQVSITLDNKDGIFKIDYDEVKVTRRVHRSGESNYLINGKDCRLKDIHELFMDTGLGREGYSVIGQGKIDQILSTKAEERRNIFEEASGITKYKYRKAESEKKLLQTDENLIRIKDLISALEDQVGPLENQSKKARKYLDLRESLKGLDINISIRNIDKQRENLKDGQEKFRIAFEQLSAEKEKLSAIEASIETQTNALTELNETINTLREQSFNLEKDSGSLAGKIDILKNNIEHNDGNCKRLQEESDALHEKITAIDREITENTALIQTKQKEKQVLEEKVAGQEEKMQALDAQISAQLQQSEELKNAIVDLLNEVSASKARISSLDVLLKNFDERKSTLKDDLQVKTDAKKKALETAEELEKSIKRNESQKAKAQSGLAELKKKYFAVTADMDQAKQEQNRIVTEFNDKQSRKRVLEDLEKGYEGYARSVKNVLKSGIPGIRGVVSKLITVDTKFVTAIEIALGGGLQNIVVSNENCAKKCIAYLKNNHLGRATFLPLTSVKGSLLQNPPLHEKGYVGIASELIGCDAEYEGVFKSLIGRTVVMDTIDNAVLLSKKTGYKYKIVTLDGQVLNPGGSLTGGSVNKTQSLLGRSKDIEQLKLEIDTLQKVIDKNEDQISDYRDEIQSIARDKEKMDEQMKQCDHEQVRITSQTENNARVLRELDRSLSLLTNESGGILSEIADIDSQKEAFRMKILENEAKIKEIRQELNSVQEQGAVLTDQREEWNQSGVSDRIAYNNTAKDIEVASAQIEAMQQNRKNHEIEIASKQTQIAELAAASEEIHKEIEAVAAQISNAKQNTTELTQKIEERQSGYDAGMEKLRGVQKLLKDQNETIYVLQVEVSRIENRNSKIEMETELVVNKLWDEYELTYNAALEYQILDFNMTQSQKEASALRSQIKALGNINIDAIEQYKEVKEKYDYLSTQKKDLDDTKLKLEDIIRQMQSIMERQFRESFEVIRTKFDSVFQELFGGGTGRLSLTEPDNILESGIEIEVQPPGKKLQNMMALSGGERALSAIALLFSVLEVRPTPFCILDEVEAALDDNNVYRFADYIKKYSKKTQFIVVTHRRGTMEAADIMYGVTMQEKGVSKLLKLKFEDLEDYK